MSQGKPCKCGCGQIARPGSTFIHGHNSRINHPMQGRKQTAEAIKKMKESRGAYKSGAEHHMYGKTHTDEVCRRLSESHMGIKQSPDLIRKRVESRKGYRPSEETRAKTSASEKGKTVSAETRQKLSAANKGKRYSPATEFNSSSLKAKYKEPNYIEKMRKAWNIKPNKAEIRMLNILNLLYPGEWKYTGDFSFTIDGKCPDFVNCNGRKLIIEYFGDHWHQGDDPEARAAIFEPFGYRTLVIWGNEMKDMEKVISRIRSFVEDSHER